MGRPKLTPEQRALSKIRRKFKQRISQAAKRIQRGEQKTPLDAFEDFCHFQCQRILTRFHGDARNRGSLYAGGGPDPADLIEGEPMERLWGRQRLMRLGPELTRADHWDKRVHVDYKR